MNTKIESHLSPFRLSDDQLRRFGDLFFKDMCKGLAKSTNDAADLSMFPSYVTKLPTGKEMGSYLSLDLGGTNFRVLLVTLENGKATVDLEKLSISDELMTGSGTQLFDYVAQCVADFLKKRNIQQQKLNLGFTFSFPCSQEGLAVGRLKFWTKNFNCSGVVGENVCQLLQEALDRLGVGNVKIVAIANDTTSTLISAAYRHSNLKIGLIVGTGTNACYLEKVSEIEMVIPSALPPQIPSHMIINTECGSLGATVPLDFIMTKYDQEIDKKSSNPSLQIYEKLVSGLYLGEVVRLLLVDLANDNLLFAGKVPEILADDESFGTADVSECESDGEGSVEATRKLLKEKFNVENPTTEDCERVKLACQAVSTRAAQIVAAGLSAIMKKLDQENVVIGYDGSVIKLHPHFRSRLEQKLKDLRPAQKFEMVVSEDGSGLGTALLVAAETSSFI